MGVRLRSFCPPPIGVPDADRDNLSRVRRFVPRGISTDRRFPISAIFPSLDEEFLGISARFRGRVLNAGSGSRDISHLVDGELVNQDINEGLPNVDLVSPLHEIPTPDHHFDVAICNAVLEHVSNPHEVLEELYRVLRPGGLLVLTVPFMQPEHLDPTDYQRYTKDGLQEIVRRHGFGVESADDLHSVYTTLSWIGYEWHEGESGLTRALLRWIVLPWLWRRSRTSTRQVHSLASAYRVLAIRDGVDGERVAA
jgi:SAM-dependent methyltransferase